MEMFNRLIRLNLTSPKYSCKKVVRLFASTMVDIDPVQKAALRENCIRVDDQDNELGPVSKEQCHLLNKDNSLLLHRAFSVFIFNEDNKMLLQQRSSSKVTYPNYYTNACCSHPLYDIEREKNGVLGAKLAAQRRLNVELGVPIEQCAVESLKFLTRLHYFSAGDGTWGEHEIDYIFILHKNVTLQPNPDEVQQIVYLSREELTEFQQRANHPFTPWFRLISANWLTKWWENLDKLHTYQDDNVIHKFNS